jgi:sortase A
MEVGDKVFVTDSMGRRYVYRVFKEFIVDPDDVQVTRPVKGKNVLTLQTCTLPDYSRRLIVRAALEEGPVASTAGREVQ